MINYSITMRPVNANLFEINAAKGRIRRAEEEGRQPEQADLDLVKTEVQKAFAVAQYTDVMSIEQFARHISTHGCVYGRADISAILYIAVDCMREQLLEGKKIRLGDLGDFSVNLSSRGADTADKFTSQNITGVNVVWEPGMQFRNLIGDAEFNLVASRTAQAALLKAIRAGQSFVDITLPETPGSDTGDGTDSGGSGNDSGGGNDSGSGGDTGGAGGPDFS
ncbi:MAG: DNA-binding protein [Bacteroidaceae bacterium]